jgi:hypothetical protein
MSIFVPIVFGDDRGMRLAGEAAEGHARAWIDDIRLGHLGSFPEIAMREDQGERHSRLPAPLAFLSPRIVAAIADGTRQRRAAAPQAGFLTAAPIFLGKDSRQFRAFIDVEQVLQHVRPVECGSHEEPKFT